MNDGSVESAAPYAPIPASVRPTRVRLGSWFQSHPRLIRVIAVLAVVSGAAYLTWRLLATGSGVAPWVFWPFFAAEAYGFLTILILAIDAWRIDPTPRKPALDIATDVVIATYDESIDILEPTIVGALKLRGRTTIHVCDDGRRPEVKALAEHYGVNYTTREGNAGAKAGNINAVLPRLTGELLLVLDADHVPSPDFLEATTGYFADPKLALVQTAHSFRNHNSVMHEEEGRHEQSLFFDVLLPGRNRVRSVFWCGSAALIRTSALREVGGLSTRTSTEDFETSLTLHSLGYEMRYHNEHLVQGLAPDNLAAYLIQRGRWAQGTIASYQPGHQLAWSRKLTPVQRFSFTGGLLHYFAPLQKVIYTANIVAVGIFAVLPINYDGMWFTATWSAWLLMQLLAATALHRGTSQPFEGIRNNLIAFEAYLTAIPMLWSKRPMKFAVTPKNEIDLGGWDSVRLLRASLLIGALTFVVVTLRWLDSLLAATIGGGFLPALDLFPMLALTVFGVIDIVIVAYVAWRIWKRRQYRVLWRFPVKLRAEVDGVRAQCIDLHQRGAAFLVPRQAVESGEPVVVTVECRTVEGAVTIARGVLTIRSLSRASRSGGTVRVGGSIVWDGDRSRTAVIEQCYVVEPYVARNSAWVRRDTRVPVLLEAGVASERAQCVDVSLGGAAFIVPDKRWLTGQTVEVVLSLENGQQAQGVLEIRGMTPTGDGLVRVGGTMAWKETAWLNQYAKLALTPQSARGRRAPIPAF